MRITTSGTVEPNWCGVTLTGTRSDSREDGKERRREEEKERKKAALRGLLRCGLAEEETRLVRGLSCNCLSQDSPDFYLFHRSFFLLILFTHRDPGLVQPAERLRAVLSVGTNRASLTVLFSQAPVFIFVH